jgi:acyl-CoA thioester hydrolase
MENYIDQEIRVRYAETDKMGVAYYANYLIWFEVGRSEFCRRKGFSYAELEALGFILVVTESHCRYRSPARYDDTILIRTRLNGINKRILTFGYQLLQKGTERVIAEGETQHLSIDSKGKPKSLPEKFIAVLAT